MLMSVMEKQYVRVSVNVCVNNGCVFSSTHVSSVLSASAALPSPWMDSMGVEYRTL